MQQGQNINIAYGWKLNEIDCVVFQSQIICWKRSKENKNKIPAFLYMPTKIHSTLIFIRYIYSYKNWISRWWKASLPNLLGIKYDLC